jgi:two-component system, OmpR family, osmolarity sensor histidine kinase EnvZ
MKFFPKTLLGRMFLLIFLVTLLNAAIIRLIFLFFLALPAGHQYNYISESLAILAEEIMTQGNSETQSRVTEQLSKSTGMIIQKGVVEHLEDIPDIPFFTKWQNSLSQNNKGFILRYQKQPESIIWLLHTKPPLFSLNIPFPNMGIIQKIIGVIFLLTTSVLMLMTYLAARHIISPLKDLAEATKSIGRNINSVDINPRGPEEVRAVGQALNEMKANLDQMIKAQEFLLAGISHDLRTPLTRLRLSTEMIVDESGDLSEGMKDDIQEIDVILHGIIELGRFNIESTEPWEFGSIKSILLDTKEKYQRAHVDLTLLNGNNLLPVRYKPMALQRLLYNLIDNSVKHGGGVITLSTQNNGNKMILCVTDQGAGLPIKMHKRHSFSDLTEQPLHGNGLGLIIVQRIAQLHEAELTLGNNAQGGAEIILSMPTYFDRV